MAEKNFVDWVESRSNLIQLGIALVSAVGIGGWAAAASDWLDRFGPIAWVAAGLCAALAVVVLWAIGAWGMKRLAERAAIKAFAETPKQVNVLDDTFVRQRIPISSFYRPGPLHYENKTFRDCEFIGPGVIAMMNHNNIKGATFNEMGTPFIVANRSSLSGAVVTFTHCTFIDCRFYLVSLLIPPLEKAEYLTLIDRMKNPDGTLMFPPEGRQDWFPK